MIPWFEQWPPGLFAVERLLQRAAALEKLYFYFGYEGLGSIALWMLALLLLLAYALRWRWSLVCWTALAVAVGGFALARVNSHLVSAIQIDFSEPIRAAKARAEEEAAGETPAVESDLSDEARQAQRDEVDAKETAAAPDGPPDLPSPEGSTPAAADPAVDPAADGDPAPETPDVEAQSASPPPKYGYRQEGKLQRTEGKQLAEKIPIDSGAVEEADDANVRVMKTDEVAEANRLDRLNLFFARWTLFLAGGLLVIDYFRHFNTTFGCYLPLPFSGRLVDGLFPKTHTVCAGPRRRKWKKYLRRAIRKGETFLFFTERDPWRKGRLRRLPWYLPLPWRIEKVTLTSGERPIDDEFLFESLWFGRYCFVVVGDGPQAVDLLDSLARFLELRHATRASAARTVNVVWALKTELPAATLDRLLPLCPETNFRLIVAQTKPPDAALAARFQETYA